MVPQTHQKRRRLAYVILWFYRPIRVIECKEKRRRFWVGSTLKKRNTDGVDKFLADLCSDDIGVSGELHRVDKMWQNIATLRYLPTLGGTWNSFYNSKLNKNKTQKLQEMY
jgi:hypothetical protein